MGDCMITLNAVTGITSPNIDSPVGDNTPAAGDFTTINATTVNISGTLTTGGGALSPQTGFKNRIINGGMVVDQRNAGASVTPANGTVTYTLDRWGFFVNQASKLTTQQNAGAVTPPAGFINYLGVTSSSAYSVGSTDRFILLQHVEGFNASDLGWGTANAQAVTLSFRVYSSLTGTFGGSLKNHNGTRSYPFSYSIPSANTWTTVSVAVPGDTTGDWLKNSSIGITVNFSLGSGSTFSGTANAWAAANLDSATGSTSVVGTNGATFYITGVQLEKGSVATPFEFRSIGQEEILCYRYFQTYSNPPLRGVVTPPSGSSRCGMVLPFVMRAQPTATVGALTMFDGVGVTTVSSVGNAYLSSKVIEFDLALTAGLTAYYPAIVYMSGTTNNLSVSAEL